MARRKQNRNHGPIRLLREPGPSLTALVEGQRWRLARAAPPTPRKLADVESRSKRVVHANDDMPSGGRQIRASAEAGSASASPSVAAAPGCVVNFVEDVVDRQRKAEPVVLSRCQAESQVGSSPSRINYGIVHAAASAGDLILGAGLKIKAQIRPKISMFTNIMSITQTNFATDRWISSMPIIR